MKPALFAGRFAMAGLLCLLGFIIVGRGLLEAAPITFTAMGGLMVMLGITRLRGLRAGLSGRR